MSLKKHLLLCIISTFITLNAFSQTPFGINLAGADFGSNMPGTYNVDYTYPTESELDYYKTKGLKLVRLPFKWERIQHTLNGNLNTDELSRIQTFLQAAAASDMQVILDLHNYCRYKLNGSEQIIGSSNLSIAHVKDLWTKLAAALKDSTNLYGYGIMNEPHDLLNSTPWFDIAQEIINGIRSTDTKTTIIVGGDSWSSAERWMTYSDNLKNLSDPSNKLIYEAHVYFDKDASGTYPNNYDADGAYPNIGIDRVTPFVNWLQANNLKGFIGEYGIPANDSRWLTVLDNFLSYLNQNCINGTYWAGGPWWGNYILSVEPEANTDKPQMAILEKYITTNNSCPTLGLNSLKDKSKNLKLYPNPFENQVFITGLNEGDLINIYNIQGQLITSQKIENSVITDLEHLTTGVYLVKHENEFIGKIIK
ncbi:cellulase family glycosylhydrolase [Pseudotamlana agarivorans]|uniref:cellulase family glycosylhydrolase n=1 Tax=Pseudotamlana agarivorans TaxID=481183 RepID=UPI00082A98BA|nr:cellulase family glycosylhydrolase [Tamlana agarivorans]